MLDGVNDEEQHAHQLGKLLETLQVVGDSRNVICVSLLSNREFEFL